jgi:hypothetical protein
MRRLFAPPTKIAQADHGDSRGSTASPLPPFLVWQATRHPVQIETEPFWQAKLDYLHADPCRKGLVSQPEHWRFSSASYWQGGGGACANDVALSAIFW